MNRGTRTKPGIGVVMATLLLSSTTIAHADPYFAPPPIPTLATPLPGPNALDAKFMAEYRAPHLAQINPKRARGRALLGTGIGAAAAGFLTMIIGGALAIQSKYNYDSSTYDSTVTYPYRPGAYIAVGSGAALLLAGGGMIAAGAIPLTEASSHEHAIGGFMVGYAR